MSSFAFCLFLILEIDFIHETLGRHYKGSIYRQTNLSNIKVINPVNYVSPLYALLYNAQGHSYIFVSHLYALIYNTQGHSYIFVSPLYALIYNTQ